MSDLAARGLDMPQVIPFLLCECFSTATRLLSAVAGGGDCPTYHPTCVVFQFGVAHSCCPVLLQLLISSRHACAGAAQPWSPFAHTLGILLACWLLACAGVDWCAYSMPALPALLLSPLQVDAVFNLELPSSASHCAHRAGHTGRMGAPGLRCHRTGDAHTPS